MESELKERGNGSDMDMKRKTMEVTVRTKGKLKLKLPRVSVFVHSLIKRVVGLSRSKECRVAAILKLGSVVVSTSVLCSAASTRVRI